MEDNPILKYFKYEHLPPYLQRVSRPFHKLAYFIHEVAQIDNIEQDMALRKLLEAKDCAVRAALCAKVRDKK